MRITDPKATDTPLHEFLRLNVLTKIAENPIKFSPDNQMLQKQQ